MRMLRWLAILWITWSVAAGDWASGQTTSLPPSPENAQLSSAPQITAQSPAPIDGKSDPSKSAKVEEKASPIKRLSEDISAVFSIAWMVALVVALIGAAWLIVKEWCRETLVIEPFDMPKDLQDLGLSGWVISQLLSDHILDLQRSARVDDDPTDIVFVELPRLQVDLQLPGIAWSVRGAIRYFKQALGRTEQRLLGEIVSMRSVYAIRLRTTSGRARDVSVRFHKPSDLRGYPKISLGTIVHLLDS